MLRLLAFIVAVGCFPATCLAQECGLGPEASDSSWREHTMRAVGIRIRLPAAFEEKIYQVRIGSQLDYTYRAGDFTRVSISFSDGPMSLDSAKPREISGQRDIRECSGMIDGKPMLLQTLRGSGTIFRNGKRSLSYDAIALIQLTPGRYLWITGHSDTKEGRDQIAAAATTVEFLRE